MKTIGLFEIKTRLSEICEAVARTGESVLVTRRGKPLVRIAPIKSSPNGSSVWDSREAFLAGQMVTDDFALPERRVEEPVNPLDAAIR